MDWRRVAKEWEAWCERRVVRRNGGLDEEWLVGWLDIAGCRKWLVVREGVGEGIVFALVWQCFALLGYLLCIGPLAS